MTEGPNSGFPQDHDGDHPSIENQNEVNINHSNDGDGADDDGDNDNGDTMEASITLSVTMACEYCLFSPLPLLCLQ